nr:MAG TPA: Peptidyl-prolyl cis-trans isomerase [Caudoviricetes sp.]
MVIWYHTRKGKMIITLFLTKAPCKSGAFSMP